MTDKEQIMIDGVDVSKCRYFLKNTEGQDYNTDEFVKGCCEAKGSCIGYEFAGYGLCRGDKDCLFKQLARKTQECEKLKIYIESNEQQVKEVETLVMDNDRLINELDQLKAENEELKKEIINKNEKIKELRFSVSDLTNRLCSLNAEKSFRIVDLEQTLDDIQKIALRYVEAQGRYDILDIINKAKGSNNATYNKK